EGGESAMARQWKTKCRGCDAEIRYADALCRRDAAVGQPRPSLCSDCERRLRRELRAVAMPAFALGAPAVRARSPLGTIAHPDAPHVVEERPSGLDPTKFGVKQEELEGLYRILATPDVPVVIAVAPTGSGKSTYLPYRLFQPFDLPWFPPDTFTRNGQ